MFDLARRFVLSFLILCVVAPLPTQAADPVYVPKELEPWKKWVLEGKPNMRCPFIGNSSQAQRICAWSSPLVLNANSSGAKFSVDWTLYDNTEIPLPGNSRYWPEGVQVNGKPVPVINPSNHPSIRLKEGSYKITGFFHWEKLPKWFPLPAATALVNLKIHDRSVPFPIYNGNSIGLGKTQMDGQQSAPKSLAIKVFRKLHDDIPFRVTTRIILDVSGPGREELLGHALLPGTIPMAIKSPLPARLEPNRRLRLQVKPGHWEIDLIARYHGPVSEIRLEDPGEPWAPEEVWSYQANTALHLTEVSNLMSIDPTRTGVPKEWINLPAYRAPIGGAFVIKEKRRGSADPNADSLAVVRKIWLDFDGGGFTFQDELTGVMTQGWRLNVDPESELGRASVAGRDQLITFPEDGKGAGVEIRQGGLQMTAVSRMKTEKNEFNAAGWQHDLNSLQATLYLPPGYRVFTASGVDRAYQTWISRWTLLDLFLMLIIAALATTITGRKWGVLALVTLAITYHQHGAPVYAWLSILASVALLGKLPPGKFKTVVTWYRNLSYVSLLIIALPFMIDQVRQSLYPQLERFGSWAPSQTVSSPQFENKRRNIPGKASKNKLAPEDAEESLREDISSSGLYSGSDKFGLSGYSSRGFKRFDPNANIQTGPGLPAWQGNRVSLSWNGPVQKEDRVRLYLISPSVNRLLGFLRVLLIAFLAYILFTISSSRDGGFRLPRFRSSGVVAGVMLLLSVLIFPAQASADIPSQEILQQLENRLLAPPRCGNHCFDIQRARVTVRDGRLLIRLEAHALEHVALPLPGHRERWLPESILVNGKPAKKILRRGAEEGVWVRLPQGIHQIILSGRLPNTDRVDLRFPHKPHKIKILSEGWEVAGVNEGRMLNDTLEITRIQKKSSRKVLRSEAPPAFVIIERLLRIGLDWQVETRVRSGVSGLGSINLKVPLLAGESILSEHVKLKDGMVLVSLGGARREVSWFSTLDKTERMVLKASEESHWMEHWTLDASTIYHIETLGLPSIIQQSKGQWRPQFRPWPGESLTLNITRPEAVPGSTLAIDFVQMNVTPSRRVTASELTLNLRSSKGGQHTVVLPEEAELESVSLNNRAQPIRQEGRNVVLPLTPGNQNYIIKFKVHEGIESLTNIPLVDLGHEAANVSYRISVPRDRWTLLARGPSVGPAVLFWGELLVVLLIAVGLGRVDLTPLKTRHWILLGLAMSTVTIPGFLIVVGWLFALAKREELSTENFSRWSFNGLQILLGVLTLAALISLIAIIPKGLLGSPDMHIVGNGSSAHVLQWYQDRVTGPLPNAWFFSVSLLFYRIAMLVWALWMAFALMKWLQWGWACISQGGLWKSKSILVPEAETPPTG